MRRHFTYIKARAPALCAHAQDAHVALVLHGVLGQGKNWRTFSKRLAQEAEDATAKPWRVLTLDLRCHGESSTVAGFAPPHDMRSCAGDVVDFVTNTLRCGPVRC